MTTRKSTAKKTSIYSVHPGVLMTRDWIASLSEKTDHSLDDWMRLIAKNGPAGERERLQWLKSEHSLGTNTAKWLAEYSVGKGEELADPEAYLRAAEQFVDAMYAGRPGLRPLHDQIVALLRERRPTIRICPGKTIVPFYRNHVVAQIKPSTKTRIDFGLALDRLYEQKSFRPPARLIDTGGFQKKDRITHRIAVSEAGDIDDLLVAWFDKAWEADE
ncbi:MAG: DUF4287 domain-containing protein [Candidatus Eisenbacteria bacterium]|uniref:DUF4287 domain-containing protein n=1 Tax=Eiseniibacteriota bacterium TaxID=2212470 RepID=A0A956LXS2_UNCEI|nr:DUF4287 domain-containing protein [Candidatus Eisenbacteria bacterium]